MKRNIIFVEKSQPPQSQCNQITLHHQLLNVFPHEQIHKRVSWEILLRCIGWRIQFCHYSSPTRCWGMGSVPSLGTTYATGAEKKKKIITYQGSLINIQWHCTSRKGNKFSWFFYLWYQHNKNKVHFCLFFCWATPSTCESSRTRDQIHDAASSRVAVVTTMDS